MSLTTRLTVGAAAAICLAAFLTTATYGDGPARRSAVLDAVCSGVPRRCVPTGATRETVVQDVDGTVLVRRYSNGSLAASRPATADEEDDYRRWVKEEAELAQYAGSRLRLAAYKATVNARVSALTACHDALPIDLPGCRALLYNSVIAALEAEDATVRLALRDIFPE